MSRRLPRDLYLARNMVTCMDYTSYRLSTRRMIPLQSNFMTIKSQLAHSMHINHITPQRVQPDLCKEQNTQNTICCAGGRGKKKERRKDKGSSSLGHSSTKERTNLSPRPTWWKAGWITLRGNRCGNLNMLEPFEFSSIA